MNSVYRVLSCLVILAVVAFGGCGSKNPPTYRAGGVVTFPDGKPLTNGWVEFQPLDAPVRVTARGSIHADGTFALGTFRPNDGAMAGQYRALVAPALPISDAEIRSMPPPIAPRFRSFETSGLKFTVTSDPAKNQFAIRVER
jgi:hypothetical protein